MAYRKSYTGRRCGRLVVLGDAEDRYTKSGRKQRMLLCKCDCGNEKEVALSAIISELTLSCGCLNHENLMKRNIKHGNAFRHNKTRLYEVWCSMIKRCENQHDNHYNYYGGKGIKVCDEWHDFSVFKEWAFSNGYKGTISGRLCSIDRINSNGNYEPNNCRWADAYMQAQNTNHNVYATYNGETLCIAEWARRYNKVYRTLIANYRKGMPIEEALRITNNVR